MDKPRHPNVIRTWVVNRPKPQARPPQPPKSSTRPAPHPPNKGQRQEN